MRIYVRMFRVNRYVDGTYSGYNPEMNRGKKTSAGACAAGDPRVVAFNMYMLSTGISLESSYNLHGMKYQVHVLIQGSR